MDYKPEDFEKFNEKLKCRHGNATLVLPESVVAKDNAVEEKSTGGVVQVNGHPVWINMCRTITTARYGFVPVNLAMAVQRLGEKDGKKYYEQWWCRGEYGIEEADIFLNPRRAKKA